MNVRLNSRTALAALGFAALIGAGSAAEAQVYLDQVDRGGARRNAAERPVDYFTFGKEVVPTEALGAAPAGGESAGNVSTVEQHGSFNRADAATRGVRNLTRQDQYGISNESLLSIVGSSNAVGVVQSGRNNVSDVAIGGNGSSASTGNNVGVLQVGNRNNSEIAVVGRNNNIGHVQVGSDLSQRIEQYGDGKTITIQQFR